MKPCEIASAMAVLALLLSVSCMVLLGIGSMRKHD
jgi:hypothetical protein